MSLPDFLLERCLESLDAVSCDYEILRDGRLICLCDGPADEVETTLDRMAIILWLADLDEVGEVFLRLLADAHVDHPDYELEWHRLS